MGEPSEKTWEMGDLVKQLGEREIKTPPSGPSILKGRNELVNFYSF